jgi:hypothetical protein
VLYPDRYAPVFPYSVCTAAASRFRFQILQRKNAMAANVITARPPITPPTMAPMFVSDSACGEACDEVADVEGLAELMVLGDFVDVVVAATEAELGGGLGAVMRNPLLGDIVSRPPNFV